MIKCNLEYEGKIYYLDIDLNKLMELREDEDPLKCVRLTDIVEKKEEVNNEDVL